MLKVALSAGHATNTPGKRSPDGEREWSFNNKVLLACAAKLLTYQNVKILRLDDPKGVRDVPLRERTNKANAWGADVLIDIHHNALAGRWGSHGGVETFVHPTGSRTSYALADVVQPLITKAMGLRNRRVKQSNLHMVRESNMPAILTEGGFMDSTTDIGALRSDAKLKAQGEAIAEGLAVYYKLKSKVSIAATTTPKKEEIVLFNSGSSTINKEVVATIVAARKVGILKADTYVDKAKNGTLTLQELTAINTLILKRAYLNTIK